MKGLGKDHVESSLGRDLSRRECVGLWEAGAVSKEQGEKGICSRITGNSAQVDLGGGSDNG